MTREELKDHILKLASDYKCWDNRLTHDEALELCHILEQEPCDDVVSRQAVLDLIEHYNSDGLGSVFYGYQEGIKFADEVKKLPPVTPTHIDLDGLKSDMKALNCGYPYGLDYLLDCLKKRLGITIAGAETESEDGI